jgi:hypothetical protein
MLISSRFGKMPKDPKPNAKVPREGRRKAS